MNRRKSTPQTVPAADFDGFSPRSIRFLGALARNNRRPWFETHREDYEEHLLDPMRKLVADLGECMLAIDAEFEVAPRVGKTISRIYRDTRFSKDKSPFHEAIWFTFKRPGQRDWWQTSVGYFFEITATQYRYGMGFGQAAPRIMSCLRMSIDDDSTSFREAISFFPRQRQFSLEGPCYKRPKSQGKPPAIQKWYDRKSFYLAHNSVHDKTLYSKILIDEMIDGFLMISPLYHYLLGIIKKSMENET